MEEETDDFDKTLVWSTEEENARSLRSTGEIGTFYLVLAAFFLFVFVFFILYFANRGKKLNAIDMMRDPNNVFEDADEVEGDADADAEQEQDKDPNKEEIPLIDIPEEEPQAPETQAPVVDNMLPKPVEVK